MLSFLFSYKAFVQVLQLLSRGKRSDPDPDSLLAGDKKINLLNLGQGHWFYMDGLLLGG